MLPQTPKEEPNSTVALLFLFCFHSFIIRSEMKRSCCSLHLVDQLFTGTSRPEPKPGQQGTCPWPRGPQGWSQRGTWWLLPRGCSERGAGERAPSSSPFIIKRYMSNDHVLFFILGSSEAALNNWSPQNL